MFDANSFRRIGIALGVLIFAVQPGIFFTAREPKASAAIGSI